MSNERENADRTENGDPTADSDRTEERLLEEEAGVSRPDDREPGHGGHGHGPEGHEGGRGVGHESGHGTGHEGGRGEGHGGMHAGHEEMFRRRFFVSTLLSIPVLVYSPHVQELLGFSVPVFPGSEWVAPVLSVVVFAYGGVPFLRMAVPEIRERSPGMMTLISMAITVAFVYSLATVFVAIGTDFFWELVTLIDVMLLGHWIEMRSVRRASSALDELARLMPDSAERIVEGDAEDGRAEGGTETVPVPDLQTGDLVLVRPGASVPADGEVESGESAVDESMITGESKPVEKSPGEEVVAGTINGDGSLRVRVTATGEDTALSGIMRLVEEAQQSQSKTQMLADRAAGWLFYAAVASALVTAVGWVAATGFDVGVVSRVVTVLVIACPHALGLAIPLVVAINTSLAARNGMLVRDRIAMERARELDVVVFDKTGTLTKGEHGVVGAATEGVGEDEALALAAAVEADSEHMIARAIREAASERDLAIPDATDFEASKGRGVSATVEGRTVRVGGPNMLAELGVEPSADLRSFADDAGESGQTVVYLVREDNVLAAFAMADVIREESRQAVAALQAMGVEVAMLTGDSEAVARSVAAELGIDTYFAEVLPEDKDEKIGRLREEGNVVAMVGDGVNDAPALARADVGIAIGSGTDVAVESADVVLVENDPRDVVALVRLSRASYRKMKENLVWAAGYNVFAIPLAAGVLAPFGILLSPAVGAILMSASTVVVAVNAQFLRRADLGADDGESAALAPSSERARPAD